MDASSAGPQNQKNDNKDDLDAHLSETVNPNVKFLYKTMMERDPRKRRVKPVQENLVQVSFGGIDDSEEDSDFDISKHCEGSSPAENGKPNSQSDVEFSDGDEEEDSSDSEMAHTSEGAGRKWPAGGGADVGEAGAGDDDEEGSDSDEGSDADMDEDDTDDSDDEDADNDDSLGVPEPGLGNIWNSIDSDEDDEDYVPKKKRKKTAKAPAQSSKQAKPANTAMPTTTSTTTSKDAAEEGIFSRGRIKVIVCCVCLSDRSADEDEIVECDNCGISVHEGCYGISESHSMASTESSASTEPWFCDSCKANAKPVCELCPNHGGIFKETDAGKWVHIVCALYTPGVAFGDVDRLNLVTLFEMPYSKWGARECSLCDDSRFSNTGVCINCDAGMCKAYFHVTCAQREGLLAEASPEEIMDIADPFFAYCKLHADKFISKVKRRNWLAIQSHVKMHTPSVIEDEKEKARFHRKLSRHREKYGLSKLKRPPSWIPIQKLVRHLHTSPSAVRGFLRKAELMGVITQAQAVPLEKQESRKKKQQFHPAFTSDFITYFLERNVKLGNLKQSLDDLSSQNTNLQQQEKVVRGQYDKLHAEVNALKQTSNKLRMEGESLCRMLVDIYGKPLSNLPETFRTSRKTRSPSRKEPLVSTIELINQCGVCSNTTDQHLLAKCDNCKKHYHLGCLDPPLTRMPKKTKLFGWQCSFCVKSSSDDSMKSHPDVDQPRRLRETIKGPEKYFHQSHIQDSLKSQRKKSLQSKKCKQRQKSAAERGKTTKMGKSSFTKGMKPDEQKPPLPKAASDSASTPGATSSTDPEVRRRVKPGKLSKLKVKDKAAKTLFTDFTSPPARDEARQFRKQDIMCVVCNKMGTLSDTVRCDDCMLFYHLGCLSPPMKKSPKVRGYAWHCEACDMSDNSEDNAGTRSKRAIHVSEGPAAPQPERPGIREASSSILFDIDVSSDEF